MQNAKDDLIKTLGLVSHVEEGGYYLEQYRSHQWQLADGAVAADTIYYMLTDDSPIGHFHLNQSDIVHFFHCGGPIRYTTIDQNGLVDSFVLGLDVLHGEELQRAVPGGLWKASELVSGSYGLISEVVVPAFRREQRTVAVRARLQELFPAIDEQLLRLAWE
jgi:predicted cupin superfamily sugar epimerase